MDAMIFWGATGQAKVLRECMSDTNRNLVALFDRDSSVSSPFPDVPVIGGRDAFEPWFRQQPTPQAIGFLVAIGGDRGQDRLDLQDYLESFGLKPLTAVHRTAFVASSAVLGPGCQILANASMCVDARAGRGCILNTGAVVDHDCRLGNGVHVGPGARLAGEVEIGDCATIGTGAVILPRVRVGERASIGAGAVVVRDVPDGVTVVGNPATPIKNRS